MVGEGDISPILGKSPIGRLLLPIACGVKWAT